MRRTTKFAVLASALMLISVAAPAMAVEDAEGGSLSVSVAQDDAGDATVTVVEAVNNSSVAVEGASVTVATVDENDTYAGNGTYTTDANGTVSLVAPAEAVNVSVTATDANRSASTTATLAAAENESDDGDATAFGERVSAFVHQLQDTNESSDAPFGVQVAAFVVANNPGNAPDHAGPPEWLVNESVNKTTGPPDHAGPSDDGKKAGGPPDDRGNDKDKGNDKKKGGGPPDHAGPPDDGGDDDGDDGDDGEDDGDDDGSDADDGEE